MFLWQMKKIILHCIHSHVVSTKWIHNIKELYSNINLFLHSYWYSTLFLNFWYDRCTEKTQIMCLRILCMKLTFMIWITWITFPIESFNIDVAPGNRENVKKNFYAEKFFTNITSKSRYLFKTHIIIRIYHNHDFLQWNVLLLQKCQK